MSDSRETNIADQPHDGWLLRQLFDQRERARGGFQVSVPERLTTAFTPAAPMSIAETGLDDHLLEAIVLKFILNRGVASGDVIAKQIRLRFALTSEFMRKLKVAEMVAHRKASGVLGDFEFQLTDKGIEQAKRYAAQSTYFGAAPVPFGEYVDSVAAQSVNHQRITRSKLEKALGELSLTEEMLDRLGQAMTAGRALFLYGKPGNGKTSIAERLTEAFGDEIWIPRAILCGGDVLRLYDPIVHCEVAPSGLTHSDDIDQRWIRIRRPTVVVGGELTMSNLEITVNEAVGVLEAPVQLKSNCGTLVIDDFGRQQMSPDKLLNRWIVPLEKQHDYLNLPSGKKIQVPFDQVIVFSTNLDPSEIVDEAFLRRIPYKIEAVDPKPAEFRELFQIVASKMGIVHSRQVVDYLMEIHYRSVTRPMRYCHARDLLLQVKNLCEYRGLKMEMTPEFLDEAVKNYFSATASSK